MCLTLEGGEAGGLCGCQQECGLGWRGSVEADEGGPEREERASEEGGIGGVRMGASREGRQQLVGGTDLHRR